MNKGQGFSFIELLITLFIMSFLLLSASNGRSLLLKMRIASLTRQLFHGFEFARSQAIKLNQIVGICGTQDFKTCSNDWNKGFIVFTVKNNRQIIYFQEPLMGDFEVFTSQSSLFKFAPDGRCLTRGTLTLSYQNQKKHEIVLYDSGRLRMH